MPARRSRLRAAAAGQNAGSEPGRGRRRGAPGEAARRPARRPRGAWRGGLVAGGLALTAVGVVAVLPSGKDRAVGPAAAYGADAVRFAEASPLVLLDLPGWRVEYADESSREEGELHFRIGRTPPPARVTVLADGTEVGLPSAAERQSGAELNWRPGPLSDWVKDRATSAKVRDTAPVLGTEAQVFQYDGGKPGDQDIAALWLDHGRVLELRAPVPDLAAFKRRLAALRRVDTAAWLAAMPASVVKQPDQKATIRAMLDGVPLPPGFDPASIRAPGLTKDRYQLGAVVTGTVACTWVQRWSEARRAGDTTKSDAAIAAMATAKDWPILREMAKEGGYPEVLKEYAAAMPSGRWYGRPLEGDVDSGLGCAEDGVTLPGAGDPGDARSLPHP